MLTEPVHGDVRIVDVCADGGSHFPQVVRRHVGCHTYCNTCGSVTKEEREFGREDCRLLHGLVEVGDHIHSLFVDILHHLLGKLCHLGLGVSVGRCRVAGNGTEVSLWGYDCVALCKVLSQADQCVVDRCIAMGVVLTQHIADYLGTLTGRPAVHQMQLVHCVQDTAVNRLKTVPHIRQRSLNDY